MNKRYLIILILFVTCNLFAQVNGFGIGVMIGEPTGFSAKYWVNNTNAFDGGLAYSFVRKNSAVSLHIDYLYHNYSLIKSNYRIPVYYGFGARLRFIENEENSLGARGVIGLVWLSDNLPLDVFVEFVPVFNIFPATALNLDLAIGARYYLK
ncbi:hypothetical protein [Rosettibacter firmus]|uniref:hypothetical protein n=1 Tax=Rosettibacter firmus TaxID=3111522 RepID=UPI00336C1D4C